MFAGRVRMKKRTQEKEWLRRKCRERKGIKKEKVRGKEKTEKIIIEESGTYTQKRKKEDGMDGKKIREEKERGGKMIIRQENKEQNEKKRAANKDGQF